MAENKFVQTEFIHIDCRFYRGHLPCKPHKQTGVHCEQCPSYEKIIGNILIIKLGAMGDVIRTTPLLYPLKEKFPHHRIHWITDFPDSLPREPWIDRVYRYETKSIVILSQIQFDAIYCLDKDLEAVALAKSLQSDELYGYTLNQGSVVVSAKVHNESAIPASTHKWITGLFDDSSKANTLSYQQEIFLTSGFEFHQEEYIMPNLKSFEFHLPISKIIIGLNTGCGGRWPTRLWPTEYWIELIHQLKERSYEPVLLGGPEEDEKNIKLAQDTQTNYFGVMPIEKFDALLSKMDVVVTAVTMALHLAIGRKNKIVLFNNIFNKREFELYNRGVILEPDPPCKCYYANTCEFGGCMDRVKVKEVIQAIEQLLESK